MELCAGGELFDRIVGKSHNSKRDAAQLMRKNIGVVDACHSLGVMHMDLKPENFLFTTNAKNAPLKVTCFGLSKFYMPGDELSDILGSPFYIAPEVLKRCYGPEADIWSVEVTLYILLCGVPPFWAETEQGIAAAILRGELDFKRRPWPSISESAKDLVRNMLTQDPKKRFSAHDVLYHPWIMGDAAAPPTDSAVFSRLKHFSSTDMFTKMALKVIAEGMSVEEIGGLKEMFKMFDTDNSGTITSDELKNGLKRLGKVLSKNEIQTLMNVADIDGNGTIDCTEFVAATLHKNKVEREENLLRAFSFLDKDGNGYITSDDLSQACRELGIHVVNHKDLIKDIDQDNLQDGQIDYNEFAAMMRKGNTGER